MRGYRHGLFDCFDDPAVFCQVCMCAGTLVPSACNFAHSRRDDFSIFHWLCMPPPIWTRANIRRLNGYNREEYGGDLMTYIFCFHCATCQDALELKDLNLAPLPYTDLTATQGPMQQIVPPQFVEVPPPPPGYVAPGYVYAVAPQYQAPGNWAQGYPAPYAGPFEEVPAA
jgi:hypothetical protein